LDRNIKGTKQYYDIIIVLTFNLVLSKHDRLVNSITKMGARNFE
jgi:hypothetical protein